MRSTLGRTGIPSSVIRRAALVVLIPASLAMSDGVR